jgi:hypothetical protein
MKQCPSCQSQYTDDTLQFCLQDGTPLQFAPGLPEKTLSYGEQETVVGNRQSNQINTPNVTNPTGWNPQQYSSNAGFQPPEKKSGAPVAVFLTAFVMLLLFSFASIGAWLYLRGARPDENTNLLLAKKKPDSETVSNTMTTAPSKPTTMATVTPTNSNAAANATIAPVDKEQIKRDVSQKVYSWKSAAESLNLNSYMSNYAGTVDYYNKKGASLATVRADKQRAFSSYSSIQITLGNMNVTPDASGETATAVFDKEWVFSGAKYSAGKVQTQLKLKKISGQWLIAGERDLKVYYTE